MLLAHMPKFLLAVKKCVIMWMDLSYVKNFIPESHSR